MNGLINEMIYNRAVRILTEEFTSLGISNWTIIGTFEDGFEYVRFTPYIVVKGICQFNSDVEYTLAEVVTYRFS